MVYPQQVIKKYEIKERQIRKKKLENSDNKYAYSHDLMNKYPNMIYVC